MEIRRRRRGKVVSSRLNEGDVTEGQWPDPDSLDTSESALPILDAYLESAGPDRDGRGRRFREAPRSAVLPRQLFAQQIQRVGNAPTRTRTWDQRIMRELLEGAVSSFFGDGAIFLSTASTGVHSF